MTLDPQYFEMIGEKGTEEVNVKVDEMRQVYDPSWFMCVAIGDSSRTSGPKCLKTPASIDPELLKLLIPLPCFLTWILVPVRSLIPHTCYINRVCRN